MKTKILYTVIAVVLWAAVGMASDVSVNKMTLEKNGDETICKIWVDGPFQFTHEIPEHIPGKPYRVLVDVFPAVHNLGSKSFSNLPVSVVSSIRSSQFALEPENVVRVVFDLKQASPYRIEKKQGQVWVYFPDKKSEVFPVWSSQPTSKNTIPEKVKTKEIASKPESPTPKTTKPVVNKARVSERKATPKAQPEPKAKADPKPQPKPKPQMAKNDIPLMGSEPKQKPTVPKSKAVSKPKTTPPPAPVKSAAPMVKYYSAQKSSYLDRDKMTTEKWLQEAQQVEAMALAEKAPDKPTQEKPEQPAKSTTVEESSDTKPTPAKVKESKKETAPVKTEKKPKDKPFKKSKPVTAEKSEPQEKPVVATIAPVEQKADDKPAAESAKKPTSRFRRQPTLPAKLKGTIVAQFPTRMVIKYKPEMSRDPFKTLIDETRKTDSQMKKKTPDIETLRLVGVIEAADGKNQALLEDIDGFGYILGEGDKVKKGYVSRIDSDKAYFQLYEYGWSRTVALHLGHE